MQVFRITDFPQQILFYLTNKPPKVTEEAIVPSRGGIIVTSGILKE